MSGFEVGLIVSLGVVTFFNVGSMVKIGGLIKGYGSLTTKIDEHENILHNGIIDKLDSIDRKVAVFEDAPAKIDRVIEEQAELRGVLKTYMKMKQ